MKKQYLIYLLSFIFLGTIDAQKSFMQTGDASFYNDDLTGRFTASGEKYDTAAYTAAHMTLPFGTMARVTNMQNGKSVIVRINDRGPFVPGRIIDVSKIAAKDLQMIQRGTTRVKVEVIDKSEAQKEISNPPVKPVEKHSNTPAETATAISGASDKSPGISGFIKVNDPGDTMQGFGVQIGSYSKLKNALEAISNLSENSQNDPYYIHLTERENGEELIRVIAGKYPTRAQAERLKNKLTQQFAGCFVITLENIK